MAVQMGRADTKSVNVKREDLLVKLRENREKHKKEYAEAFLGYRIEVKKVLANAIADLEKNPEFFDDGLYLQESPPENHTAGYEEVISMMEMSVDEVINIDSVSFQQYVLDNWSWKSSFAATSSKYVSNVR